MVHEKICVMTDCACDLPKSILKIYDINMAYFYIETEKGRFQDIHEITSQNVFEYLMDEEKTTKTSPPPVEEFIRYFIKQLGRYEEIIYITLSSKISTSMENVIKAATQMKMLDKRIHIFDSKQLSTGTGLLALKAVEMAKEGKTSKEILLELEKMRTKICATFIVQNLDYLYQNKRVNKQLKTICDFFNIHLVLQIKDGFMKIKSIQIGNYERSIMRYIRKELKNIPKEKMDRLCITYAGVNLQTLKLLKVNLNKAINMNTVMTIKASATTSGNCGPQTIGLFFIREE